MHGSWRPAIQVCTPPAELGLDGSAGEARWTLAPFRSSQERTLETLNAKGEPGFKLSSREEGGWWQEEGLWVTWWEKSKPQGFGEGRGRAKSPLAWAS